MERGVKVNGEYYCDNLLAKTLLPDIFRKSLGWVLSFNRTVHCMAHRACDIVAFLERKVPDFVSPTLSVVSEFTGSELELCTDVIVSAAARRSISVGGGGAPPGQKKPRGRRRGGAVRWGGRGRRAAGPKKSAAAAARRGVGGQKQFFSKIHEKISFYPQNFLRNFFSHQSFEVCR